MACFKGLIYRHFLIFFRTKGNILFAGISTYILVILHFIFLRSSNIKSWHQIATQMGIVADESQLGYIVDSLTFASAIPMGAVTITIVTLGIIVADREKDITRDFAVSPITGVQLYISYIVSSLLIGVIVLSALFGMFLVYFSARYSAGFTPDQLAHIILSTLFALLFSNLLMLLTIHLVTSQQVLGSFGTILGSLLGFISGAYIPISMFGEKVSNIVAALPFYQLTVLFRQIFLRNMHQYTPFTQNALGSEFANNFGLKLWIKGHEIPPQNSIFFIICWMLFIAVLLTALPQKN